MFTGIFKSINPACSGEGRWFMNSSTYVRLCCGEYIHLLTGELKGYILAHVEVKFFDGRFCMGPVLVE